MTEVRVAGGDVTSHTLEGLEKYTWYEVAVQPFFQSVLGRESTAQVRTLDDGNCNLINFVSVVYSCKLEYKHQLHLQQWF